MTMSGAIDDYTSTLLGLIPKHALAYFTVGGGRRYYLGQSKTDNGNVAEAQQLYQAAIDDIYTSHTTIDPELC